MGAFSPRTGPHHVHRLHRTAAAATGGFLLLFGAAGALRSADFVSTSGPVVLGLFTNGLLSLLSLLTGGVLLASAVRSGPAASTVSVVCGALFTVSGFVNVLVLNSPMNLLAFRMTNVIFSLLVGATLMVLGSYGRFTGSLPEASPYSREHAPVRTAIRARYDGALERAMAEAERAVVLHRATAEQILRVRAAASFRTHEQRLAAFLDATGLLPGPVTPVR